MTLYVLDPTEMIHKQLQPRIYKDLTAIFTHTLDSLINLGTLKSGDFILMDVDNIPLWINDKSLDSQIPNGVTMITTKSVDPDTLFVGNPIDVDKLYLLVLGIPQKIGYFIDNRISGVDIFEKPNNSKINKEAVSKQNNNKLAKTDKKNLKEQKKSNTNNVVNKVDKQDIKHKSKPVFEEIEVDKKVVKQDIKPKSNKDFEEIEVDKKVAKQDTKPKSNDGFEDIKVDKKVVKQDTKPKSNDGFEEIEVDKKVVKQDTKPKSNDGFEEIKVDKKVAKQDTKPKSNNSFEEIKVDKKVAKQDTKPKSNNSFEEIEVDKKVVKQDTKPKSNNGFEEVKATNKIVTTFDDDDRKASIEDLKEVVKPNESDQSSNNTGLQNFLNTMKGSNSASNKEEDLESVVDKETQSMEDLLQKLKEEVK